MTQTTPHEELAGQRISLRRNAVEFAPHLREAALASLATVGRWMGWCHPAFSEVEATEWYRACRKNWDEGTEYEFSIFGRSGEYIGAAGLNQINRQHNFANLGYWVRESRQGQGYATDATRLLADFGFKTLRLHRIEIVVAEENYPSRRVAEKCGALLEGVLRNRLSIHGAQFSAAMYSLLPNDAATGRLIFDVFGKRMLVERSHDGWRLFSLSVDGKHSPVHVSIPAAMRENELEQYLDDIFHEAATAHHPCVRRILVT